MTAPPTAAEQAAAYAATAPVEALLRQDGLIRIIVRDAYLAGVAAERARVEALVETWVREVDVYSGRYVADKILTTIREGRDR